MTRRLIAKTLVAIFVSACWVALCPEPAQAQRGAANGEWRSYGGDLGSTKYSPLDQIDATNFGDLEIAWRWQSVDGALDIEALQQEQPAIRIRNLKATPLMVGGVLYISTPLYQAAAIDAATGETLWVHDPKSYLGNPYPHATSSASTRAVWPTGPTGRRNGCCGERMTPTCSPSMRAQGSRSGALATTAA